ncbi:gamma-glutamyltransferase [bacterium SCSIO 12696]|nr:gamma-glutamyltransferase [bacterium SCSIO 12696]
MHSNPFPNKLPLKLLLSVLLTLNLSPASAEVPTAKKQSSTSQFLIRYDTINHPVTSTEGMVVSQNSLASQVGAEILEQGGNAVDAAVATGFALAVTLPRAGNIGGSGFMLVHLAEENKTVAIEYYGQAPQNITPELLATADGEWDRDKRYSHLGVGIPGTVAGLYHAHQKYGKLPWKTLVKPAIELAQRGITVTPDLSYALSTMQGKLINNKALAETLYKKDQSSYQPGERLKQTDLAWSLKQIAKGGADAFYKGAIADKIVADMKANGGVITHDDLANYRVNERQPIWGDYRGYQMAYMPPPSNGIGFKQLMNILENFPIAEYGSNSSDNIHLLSEAQKLVTVDRTRFMGGYPQHKVPEKGLGSKAYAKQLAELIDMQQARPITDILPGDPLQYESRDTTHYSVVDKDGNAVSNTYTISSSFGAYVMAEGTGIILNDHLGNFGLSVDESKVRNSKASLANVLRPGKRVVSGISPVIVLKDGKPVIISGSPGGARIMPVVAQVLMNVIDHGMNIADATQTPRSYQGISNQLELESGHPKDVVRALEQRGHSIKHGATMGSTQSILIEGSELNGAADTRRPDAKAVGVK